ncbi:MAG: glycoside hydrolase family 3 N-terminal domain-containing protein, partial [Bacteroidota bacterium]
PVADVDREPKNPIIGTRAYGRDPIRAGKLAAAFVEGAHAGGQLTCAKHFPGHGGTTDDSHATLPSVGDDREALHAVDLAPFRAAIAAGADTVMTAHVAYPALDPTGAPATASAPILRGLLRDEMGFRGVVVSDSLQMAGIRQGNEPEGAVAARLLAAGVDLFVDPVDPRAVVDGIVSAIEAGTLDERLLDDALARVEALRQRLISLNHADVFRQAPQPAVRTPEALALATRVAHGALRGDGALPELSDGTGALVVLVKPAPRPHEPPTVPFGQTIERLLPQARYVELEPFHEDEDEPFEQILGWAREARQLVIATVVRPAAWHAFGLAARERRFVQTLLTMDKPTTLAVLGGPRGLAGMEGYDAAIVTGSDVPASQIALAEVLAGRSV